ncbi:hypothetical protein GC176_03785 [bacterium]|nr:hypothetical protein [bacterium]
MNERDLQFVVQTPHDVVLDLAAQSVRVLTETGHVGLRPQMEPALLAVEAGIVNVRTGQGLTFVGSAGGLLTVDGSTATLLTPLAVTGENEQQIVDELQRLLSQPSDELDARAALSRLEGRILSELRDERSDRYRREVLKT